EQIQMAKNYFEQNLARQFVVRTVLMQKVIADKITITDEEKKKRVDEINEQLKKQNTTLDEQLAKSPFGKETAQKEFDDGMLLDKLLKVAVIDKIEVKPEEVKKAIDEIKANNAKIETENKNLDSKKSEAKKKIEGLKKQIADGADFAALAKEHSDCPSKEKGGDLGEFQRGQMVKEFEEAAFTQPIGKVGEIVETKFGYHLILVTAKNPAVEAKDGKPAKPETVKASHILVKTPEAQQPRPVPTEKEMTDMLKNRQAQQSVQAYIQDLLKKAKIENKAFPDMKF
ncbi:MAG: peptidylprolyl isomerase, partial [Kiritimatiellae bacterium]|nr:peptidylprolyl isomerase [Kiritimatiellia bacterium]